jgi:mono/diheme cytochrome c family protein
MGNGMHLGRPNDLWGILETSIRYCVTCHGLRYRGAPSGLNPVWLVSLVGYLLAEPGNY